MVSDTFDGLYGKCGFPAGTLVLGAWTKIYGLTARPCRGPCLPYSLSAFAAPVKIRTCFARVKGLDLNSNSNSNSSSK